MRRIKKDRKKRKRDKRKVIKSYYFTFLLFTFYFLLLLQMVSAQYHFDSFTTDNGLPQNGVRDIVQTPDGYLWFTTFDGLVRCDGAKFVVFDKNNSPGILSNRFFCCTSSRTEL